MSSHPPWTIATFRCFLLVADGKSLRGHVKTWTQSKASVPIIPANTLLAKASCMEKPRVNGVGKIHLVSSSETLQNCKVTWQRVYMNNYFTEKE